MLEEIEVIAECTTRLNFGVQLIQTQLHSIVLLIHKDAPPDRILNRYPREVISCINSMYALNPKRTIYVEHLQGSEWYNRIVFSHCNKDFTLPGHKLTGSLKRYIQVNMAAE